MSDNHESTAPLLQRVEHISGNDTTHGQMCVYVRFKTFSENAKERLQQAFAAYKPNIPCPKNLDKYPQRGFSTLETVTQTKAKGPLDEVTPN